MHRNSEMVYADNKDAILKVIDFKYLHDYELLLIFSNGEKRIYNAEPLLSFPAFEPLKDIAIFKDIRLIFNTISWCNESIDIAPESLYKNSVPFVDVKLA